MKIFLVWLLFFVDLCSHKNLVKALNFNLYVHKAPSKVEAVALTTTIYSSNTPHI